uniref:portal protein n=2 Tax=Helicobacter bizzozeronii TaxID=56877 RepID=UPI003988BEC9
MIKRDKDLIMGGLSVVELWAIEDKQGYIDIELKALDPLSFIIDYLSTHPNALDARRFHKVLLKDEQSLKQILPSSEIIYTHNNTKERLARIVIGFLMKIKVFLGLFERTLYYGWIAYFCRLI